MEVFFSNQWDVLCVVEHEVHKNVGLIVCSHEYTLCYVRKLHGDYPGIMKFIHDHYCPQIIFNDDNGIYIVGKISYGGELIWLVGVYASNV